MLRLQTFAALRHREFRLLWAGQAAASLAMWMDQIARGWLMYELTNSPAQLGLVQGVQAIPMLLLAPSCRQRRRPLGPQAAGGARRDAGRDAVRRARRAHHDRPHSALARVCDGGRNGHRSDVSSTGPSGHGRRCGARYQLTNAIGLNSLVFNVARSIGPALAGALIARLGTASSYVVQAGCYALATVWTLWLRPTPSGTPGGRAAARASFAQSIVEGWTFSWRNEVVRPALLITMCASLFIMPFMTLLPVFARDLLRVGATGQGALLTAMGIGAVGSAVLIASLGDRLPRGPLMLGGVTLYGFSVIAFAASPSFRLSLGLMTIVGLAHVTSYALVQTVIQTYSPAAFRGRTMAIFHMSSVVVTLGSMLAGTLAALVGARWAAAAMGAAGALLTITIGAALPHARRIR